MLEQYFKKIIIYLFFLILGIIIIRYFFIYFSPFIIATILASLINPIVKKVEKKLPRGFAVFIVLAILICLLITIIIIGVSQVYFELERLLRNLPDYRDFDQQFQWVIAQNNRLQEVIDNLQISSAIREALPMIYNAIKSGLEMIVLAVLNLLSKLPLILTILFLSFIATFFISKDRDLINDFILNLFSPTWKQKIYQVEKELMSSSLAYIRAQVILISITGLIAGIGLSILGNKYALILSILAALLDLIPIIGPSLIFIPWAIYLLIVGEFTAGFSLIILYLIIAAVRQGIEGKIMGSNLGFHPLAMMIALYVGFRILGPLGFILGPAILVIIKAIIRAEIIVIGVK